jgi:hypothetical protein
MRRRINLSEGYLRKVVRESVSKLLRETKEIRYTGDDFNEEWEYAGISPDEFVLIPSREIAKFHSARIGFEILRNGEEFGEAWLDRDGLYHGNSEDDDFGGYLRCFEGYGTNGMIEDMLDKLADAINNPEDEDEDDEDYDF